MAVEETPVFHRLLPSPGVDMPVTLNLREYRAANENLSLDSTQMRWSRTAFQPEYRSDMEHYQHYYWVFVENGTLTLSFDAGDQIVAYRKDNKEEIIKPGTSVELNPGDLIVMVNITVSAYNGYKEETTILTVGYVNQDDPAPCHGGCWLP